MCEVSPKNLSDWDKRGFLAGAGQLVTGAYQTICCAYAMRTADPEYWRQAKAHWARCAEVAARYAAEFQSPN